ncbi:MAG: L,D-transpeptidase [Acidimicrobiia bacterium]
MRIFVSILALALVATACGVETLETTTTTVSTTTTIQPTTTTVAPDVRATFSGIASAGLPEDTVLVGMAKGDLDVYQTPADSEPVMNLPATTILDTVTVVTLVEAPADGWARVMLPVRPNGSEGWVRAADIEIYVVEGRLLVDLSEKTLTYYRGGEVVLTSTVAVGTERNPTPTGHFYVTDNVTLANPNSPWGPHALGLSGRSDSITEYNGGDGIIGIHGTNRPGSIGQAASLGCVRLPNDVITAIHQMVSIGTPVEIRA